ncbi:MAG: LysE family translocator [Verrucomicrobiales bacterium]
MEISLPEILTFALTMAAGQFSPGPDMLLILKNSMAHPRSVALSTVLGITLGIIVHTTVVITGLATFSERFPEALQLLWLIGAGYLAWIGVRLLASVFKPQTDHVAITVDSTLPPAISCKTAFAQGLITNLTNPKVFLFFSGILATSLSPSADLNCRVLFGVIIVGEAVVLWSLFVLLLQWPPVARVYANSVRWINGIFGVLLLWIAVTVFWQQS